MKLSINRSGLKSKNQIIRHLKQVVGLPPEEKGKNKDADEDGEEEDDEEEDDKEEEEEEDDEEEDDQEDEEEEEARSEDGKDSVAAMEAEREAEMEAEMDKKAEWDFEKAEGDEESENSDGDVGSEKSPRECCHDDAESQSDEGSNEGDEDDDETASAKSGNRKSEEEEKLHHMTTEEGSESAHEEDAKRKASKSKKLHGGPRRYGYFMESRSDNLELAVSVPCVSSQKMRRRQHHPLLRYRPLGRRLRQSDCRSPAEALQRRTVEQLDRPACMIRNSTMLEKFFCGVQDVHIQAMS